MHEEALKSNTAAAFPDLIKFKNFYLVGGTALALHIGHRISIDFDMFTCCELSPGLLQKVKKVYPKFKIAITYRSPEQLNILIDGIKVTFFQFEYPLIDKLSYYLAVPVAGIKEIAAMKAFAIGKRLSYKNYIDWYFLLKEKHINLSEVMRLAKKKFGSDFNDRLFLGQLVYMSDIPTQKIDFLRDNVSRKTVEQFLENTVREFTR